MTVQSYKKVLSHFELYIIIIIIGEEITILLFIYILFLLDIFD